jgi:hypothetical protein
MPTHKAAFLLMLLLPGLACADDSSLIDASTDTFGSLLEKQAKLLDSEMDMKIRSNQGQGLTNGGIGANPLPGTKQEVNDKEPVVEAIWGLKGKEVAEVSYLGRRVPVSMQEPFISKVDGWKLENIQQYMITLIRADKAGKVLQRKTIMLDFLGGDGGQTRGASSQVDPNLGNPVFPITPGITPPLLR